MLNSSSSSGGNPEVERAKLEKKRERNRIAATKCRQRKLEKISTLGEKEEEEESLQKHEGRWMHFSLFFNLFLVPFT